jgi:hypothetical protein
MRPLVCDEAPDAIRGVWWHLRSGGFDRVLYSRTVYTDVNGLFCKVLDGSLTSTDQTSSKFSLRIWLDKPTVSDHRHSVKLQTLSFPHGERCPAAMRPWRRVEPT